MPFISALVVAAVVILEHVAVIDGTGAPAMPDRNVTIENGRIASITAGAGVAPSDGTTVLDLRGDTVMPGIVGMHDHLYCMIFPAEGPSVRREVPFSAPRLYLANGVTTIRTAGSVDPYLDITIKSAIDSGSVPGPHMYLTGPYFNDMNGPDDARQQTAFWADRGITSFKAYVHIKRDELRAVVGEAHKRGLKVTGHLCSVTYPEAVDAGIDNFEHGFFVNTQLDPDKKPDACSSSGGDYTMQHMSDTEARDLIALIVSHHVAVTSTLPSTAASANVEPLRAVVLDAMAPILRDQYLAWRTRPRKPSAPELLRKEMALERAFVAAGGLLLAGPDPVGMQGNIPGFGDQHEIELLVDGGFTPLEAIRIATFNGATFLGVADRIGSIAAGKNADLLVVKGDPSTRIADIENVQLVFKDGVAYDTKKLLESVKGHYGDY